MRDPYKNTVRPRINRSLFDLSYTKKFTCDMGELIPVWIREGVPGDVLNISHNVVVRFQPMLAPLLHEVNLFIETYFTPYRILWHDDIPAAGSWEDFITGGADGTEAPTLPKWSTTYNTVGTLWDYLEYRTGINAGTGGRPVMFPLMAYNKIWNDYYRDETQQTERAYNDNQYIAKRNWEKDYFTSSLPWEQRGTAPALPISGTIPIDSDGTQFQMHTSADATDQIVLLQADKILQVGSAPTPGAAIFGATTGLQVDVTGATTFGVNDLRLAFQMHKILERAATGGARYTEYLKGMYGVDNGDARLQRPEWIGGMKVPVIFSEVLQTSESGSTPQGTMAGHGISVGGKRIGTYRVKEFGVFISLLSVMPKAAYSQGVDKQWLKDTRWDYFNPLLANTGEQPITHAEIYQSATEADNISVFGYQGRYNEMRTSQDRIAGDLRSTYQHWHLGRLFSSKPTLGNTFLTYENRKDIFAAPSVDGLIVNCANIIKAARPLPVMPNPGYIDH